MNLSWPNHLLTLTEWEALPEDSDLRLELAEGLLVLWPKPMFWHQHAQNRLTDWCNEQLPADLIATHGVDVIVTPEPLTIRAPDLVVTRAELFEANPARCSASDVFLAAEILSEGTRRIDRVLKPVEYAEAGIPQYWIIDVDEPTTVLSYVLVEDAYELSGEYSGMSTLEIAGNPVTIDLSALIRR